MKIITNEIDLRVDETELQLLYQTIISTLRQNILNFVSMIDPAEEKYFHLDIFLDSNKVLIHMAEQMRRLINSNVSVHSLESVREGMTSHFNAVWKSKQNNPLDIH